MWLRFIIKASLSRPIIIIDKKMGFCILIDLKYFHSKCIVFLNYNKRQKAFQKCKSESAIHVCKFDLGSLRY